ncbi:MAG TPA: hypothetical protein VGE27_08705 [Gemmatimonas sp.]|uniref:hypothetical protein n=1 Tax=Gemmatimonas sp. TaxID=1962908 RepID=UPI002EDA81C1
MPSRIAVRLAGALTITMASLAALTACDGIGRLRTTWVADGDVVLRETVRAGRLTDQDLREASGLTPSQREPGMFWFLNDSGNDERLFAADSAGRALGTVWVTGTRNQDWEALSSGPCPEGHCLYIADTGDNMALRPVVQLLRLPEPSRTAREVPLAQTLTLRYADGAHDVEAMYVAPDTSVWLITKRPTTNDGGAFRPVRVYRVPPEAWGSTEPVTVSVMDSLPVVPVRRSSRDWVTDASLSAPDSTGRRRLALLTYGAVHIFEVDSASGRPGAAVARCSLPIHERSAEGITWLPDGRILLVNEGRGGVMYAGLCP